MIGIAEDGIAEALARLSEGGEAAVEALGRFLAQPHPGESAMDLLREACHAGHARSVADAAGIGGYGPAFGLIAVAEALRA